MNQQHVQMLVELTGLPTAAGREDRVVDWVERWADARPTVVCRRDRYGNLLLKHKAAASRRPIILAAHMDHPAFVALVVRPREIQAEFRGGMDLSYFENAQVQLHHGERPPMVGRIVEILPEDGPKEIVGRDRRVVVRFDDDVVGEPGDVLTWALPAPRVEGDRLLAPACDDLAGVAAALAAFDAWLGVRDELSDVRVLLTRAEEVGFIGALGACRSKIIPRGARIVALENSRSYADSPIGGGPIIRVGDRMCTFNPELTYQLTRIAKQLTDEDESYRWQRKLMPGGICEASAYQEMGFTATCVCLALGNYHNMNAETGKVDSETISVADYHGLVHLLVQIAQRLDQPDEKTSLRHRLDDAFERRRGILR